MSQRPMPAVHEHPRPELEDGEAPWASPPPAPLFPPGNPLRPRGLLWFAVGALLALLLMGLDRRFSFGAPLAAGAIGIACFGLLDALGAFDDAAPAPRSSVALRTLMTPLGALVGAALMIVVSLRMAVSGVLPYPIVTAAVLVTTSCLALLAACAWALQRLRSDPSAEASWRAALRRPGVWLLALGIGLYMPMLGSFSLIDPWETHYGEVAREMLARDDWISLWWAQDGWFFSKPALNFWIQGLSFLLLGVRYEPDCMLAAAADGAFPQPEWASRVPVVALTLVANYLAYRAVARVFGWRAGFLGGLVLTTAPYWFFLSHQSMTDMPYAAPLTGALALVALGMAANPDETVASFEVRLPRRTLRLSAAHLLLFVVSVTSLPQILYLISRNVRVALSGPHAGLRVQSDQFLYGSGLGNCGAVPGNEPCSIEQSVTPFEPALAGLLWAVVLGLFLYVNRGERRVQRLCFLGAWYLTALAFLAKGAPGLVLPVLVALVAFGAARRFGDLARLELPGLALLVACVALPWFVQAYMRHGTPFTDRLFFHDMYKRAFVHVHDTNVGDDVSFRYYLWQLGYGLFPWTGLAVVGVVSWLTEREARGNVRAQVGALLALWAVLGFSLFAVSLTKFHHYALPVAPPLCLLTGIALDRWYLASTGTRDAESGGFDSAIASLLAFCAGAVVYIVGRDLFTDGSVEGNARLLHLFIYNYKRPWPKTLDFDTTLRVFTVMSACACAMLAVPRLRKLAAAALCAIGIAFTVFALNIYFVRAAPHWGQRETILKYYTSRASDREPLVAFQMNWKGENFYTGNRIPAFVTTGAAFEEWLTQQREQGVRVVYFTTEHSRLKALKRELGDVKEFRLLTGPEVNNKFFLARVEL